MMMTEKFSLDRAMYGVVIAMALLITLSTALATVAVVLGVIFIVYEFFRTKKLPTFDKPLLKVLAIYFSAQIVIAATSLDPLVSFREVFGEFHRFIPLIFAMTFVKNKSQLRGVLIATMISSLINDATGVYQYLAEIEARPLGLEYSPTFFASAMLMQIPTMIFLAIEFSKTKWLRYSAIFTAVLSLLCLGLSMTRGAWLAFIGTMIIFAALEKKYRVITAKLFAALFVIFLIVLATSPKLQERVQTLTDLNFQSNSERVLMWKSSIEIFSDYPIHGIGQKMFELIYNTKYISPDAKERPDETNSGHSQPHNNLLFAATEGGIIGTASFIFLHVYLFRRFFIQYKNESSMKFSAGLTLLLIFTALHLEGLTDTNFSQVKLMREFLVISGSLMALNRE